MLMRFILWTIFVLYISINSSAIAQSHDKTTHPVVGKQCPPFIFKDVQDNEKKYISLNSLKGKPFILDFFSTGCTACFASFSKINKLNREFSGKVKFILVGRKDKYIRNAYTTFKKRQNLLIPHVFDISTINKFNIDGYPYVIWVNAKGIVTAITGSTEVSEENISAFFTGKPFLSNNADEARSRYESFNFHKPFEVDNSVWIDSLFFQRSLFIAWKKEMGNAAQIQIENYLRLNIPLQVVGWPLSALYKLAYTNRLVDWTTDDTAYYGKYHYAPIYEMKDKSIFDFKWDQEKNMFCYSQILATNKNNPEEMLRIMREDLFNTFGYTATVESREMPYLRLLKEEDAYTRLKTKGGVQTEESFIGGVNFKNVPVASLVSAISYKASLVSADLPLIDETGIDYPIDIQFSASMTDIDDIIKELPSHGLKIVPGMKEMKVLVIRDKKINSANN